MTDHLFRNLTAESSRIDDDLSDGDLDIPSRVSSRSGSETAAPATPRGSSAGAQTHLKSSTTKRLISAGRACDACRKRKIRCDRGTPTCAQCSQQHWQCLYERPEQKRGRRRTVFPAATDSKQTLEIMANAAQLASSQPPAAPVVLEAHNAQLVFTPNSGLEAVMPFSIVQELCELFFTVLWPRYPIIHQPTFLRRLANRHDRTEAAFYGLVLNICAATCVTCRGVKLLPSLNERGLAWESAGRIFNAALRARGERIHQLIRSGTSMCLQNVLLVAIFERAIGSPVADRLMGEAERLALSFHYGSEWPGLDAVETELRKRLFWVLYVNDKQRAIIYRQPMMIRLDEADLSYPTLLPDEQIPTSPRIATIAVAEPSYPSLDPFLDDIDLCHAAEQALLRWRSDLRTPHTTALQANMSLNEALTVIMCKKTRPINAFALLRSASTPIQKAYLAGLPILKHALCVEMYYRYSSVSNADVPTLAAGLANAAGRLIRHLSSLDNELYALLELRVLLLVELCFNRLKAALSAIIDPLIKADAVDHVLQYERILHLAGRSEEDLRQDDFDSSQSQPSGSSGATSSSQISATTTSPILASALNSFADEDAFTTSAADSSFIFENPIFNFAEPGLGTMDLLRDISSVQFDSSSFQDPFSFNDVFTTGV